jgi:multidrug efflux pump subunit AcrA (membrane-fusion protein)
MKKRYYVLILAIIMLSGTAFFAVTYYKKSRFETTSPQYDDIVESVYGLGTIRSYKFFEFKSGVVQNLKKVFVKEGDQVKTDTPLFQSFSGQIFRSPIPGTITDLPFHEAENIPIGKTVIQIIDLSDIYIEVSLEQEAALRVKPGDKAMIALESFRGKLYPGKVDALFPKNGEFLAQISAKGIEENILPGMTVDVTIEVGKKEKALLIPHSAVDAGMVWRERNGKKEKVKVSIGHSDGIWAEVKDGDIKITDMILIPQMKKQRK